MKKRFYHLLLSVVCFTYANSEIRITEIMTNNVSTIVSEKYNYDGYVEFFNDGDNVDLKGWKVSNMKGEESNWSIVLDSSHVLPKGYSLLFFGDKESGSTTASLVKSNYVGSVKEKLTTDAGSISFEKDGITITLSYPKQYPHISYCENGFMIPTPGEKNGELTTTISNRVAQPKFIDNQPGYYDDFMTVELGCETEGAQIFYTLNGDAPTDKSYKYEGPISIDSSIAIRARAFKDGKLYSEILTGTYVLPDTFYTKALCTGTRLPIVSIVAGHEDMFGPMLGMYVDGENGVVGDCYKEPYNWYQDWTRSANFEYILDGKVVDSQEVEIGIYGGCTRIHKAKSLKIKANKRSGKNKMQYDNFFPSRDYKKYKSLALRNGGNGYSYVPPRWRDMFIQSLGEGMNLDLQKVQPVSYYLNGEFYGMMLLTERANEDYVYHNYGLDEDEIDFFELLKSTSGDRAFYDKMISYVKNNYSSKDFYNTLDKMMDIDEYVDYQILEQYAANTDWVSNNLKFWRKHDGGRFRWIVFDTDFGMSKAAPVDKDMLKFATSEKGSEAFWVLLRSCLQNEDFRWKFADQYFDRLQNQFTDERINANLDSIAMLTRLDMCATMKKGNFLGASLDLAEYDTIVERMRRFAIDRKPYVIAQLKKEFNLGDDTVDVKVRPVFPNSETPDFKFLMNNREIASLKYNTWRYSGSRVKIKPIVPKGYIIQRWEINNVMVKNADGTKFLGDEYTANAESGELKFSIYFDNDPNYVLPTELYLNEVCASNATYNNGNGEFPDWIEVYNGSEKDVDLAGMVVANVTKAVKCTIPDGSKETIVPAHGHIILWADKKPENGPLHLNFKLGATASEKIILTKSYKGSDVEISSLLYEPHQTDESFGRVEDGLDATTVFDKCISLDGVEVFTSTPLAANGSVICEKSNVEESIVESGINIYVQDRTVFAQNIERGKIIEIISPLGAVIAKKTVDSDLMEINVPASGIYIVRVDSECRKVVAE